ncbi:MAG: V-type ATP synthase subunit D [Erysipelotrichaceae bacterium]
MANKQVFPTKGNLIATKKSYELAAVGYDLLDRKRNILIREMMQLLDKVKILRDDITKTYQDAYDALKRANITNGSIAELVKSVPIDNGIEVSSKSVMGVDIPKISYTLGNREMCYGLYSTDSNVDYAYQCFQKVKEITIMLAEVENSVYRLANAIQKTQKRANALKNIVLPDYEATVKFIAEALEEKEREEFSRQKVIKNNKDKEKVAN